MVGSSSRLIAASCALHRLPTPRHSPCALSNLTTLILVFRESPDLPAVRRVQQESPAFLVSAFARRAPAAESDGPWPRLIRFSSCIRRCGYNYPLCRYSLFKDPTSLQCGVRNSECGMKGTGIAAVFRLLRTPRSAFRTRNGGAEGIRTHDLLVANQALSRLSYGPRFQCGIRSSECGVKGSRGRACRSLRTPHSPLRIGNGGPRWIRTTDLALIRGAL